MRSDIPGIRDEELASLSRRTAQRIRSFRHHVLPARGGIVEDNSSIGGVFVGQDEEFVAGIVHPLEAGVGFLSNDRGEDYLLPRGVVELGQIAEEQRVAVFTLAAL